MIYYFILALVEIWIYLSDNWKELTGTAIATGIGIILGKRMGIKFAIRYFMKTFRLERKSVEQQQLEHHEREIIRMGGSPWNASMLPSAEKGLLKSLRLPMKRLKLLRRVGWLVRCVGFIIPRPQIYQLLRRKMYMSKFKSRKFILAVVGGVLIILNEGLDMGIDSETVLAFAGLLAVWISGESYVDGKRAEGVKPNDNLNIPIEPPI